MKQYHISKKVDKVFAEIVPELARAMSYMDKNPEVGKILFQTGKGLVAISENQIYFASEKLN